MCGIAGYFAFNKANNLSAKDFESAVSSLKHRGPDAMGIKTLSRCQLGHVRLSIIDLSESASQPFVDSSGRYTIVFNGEIFNYKELRATLADGGYHFTSESDTEVLLYAYIEWGSEALDKLNGFFSFAIYDEETHELFLARDRYGIKPLLYSVQSGGFYFTSEMRSFASMNVSLNIDEPAVSTYFQTGYIPSPFSVYHEVKKVEPGTYIHIQQNNVEIKRYYRIPYHSGKYAQLSYTDATKELRNKIIEAVQIRLISDVPLGAFLSGGVDSSVIVAAAAQHKSGLKTFSVGYKDYPYFDETSFALKVAEMHKTDHHVISLTKEDMQHGLTEVLEHIDEPFADSSCIPMHLLSKEVRKHVTVALSGDAGDELFAGYTKHSAEWKTRNGLKKIKFLRHLLPLLQVLPQSRSSYFSNKIRQINKLLYGIHLSDEERYITWASVLPGTFSAELFLNKNKFSHKILNRFTNHFTNQNDFNDVLYADMQMVLEGDMLRKVDMMSMKNGLEVRVPFLDYRVVNFAFQLPSEMKIDGKRRKKILKDAFQDILPPEIVHRSKMGFELPLRELLIIQWNQFQEFFDKEFIENQAMFSYQKVEEMKSELFSSNPGESHFKIWSFLVFQSWWKNIRNKG